MLKLAQDEMRPKFEEYENMPLRAFGITFIYNDSSGEELPEQVYQGRSVSEAVQVAEIHQLDNPNYPGPQLNTEFKAAWTDHWKFTSCKPRFIVGKVRDLGLVRNQDDRGSVQISDRFVSREEYNVRSDELIAMTKCRDDILAANEKRKGQDPWVGL